MQQRMQDLLRTLREKLHELPDRKDQLWRYLHGCRGFRPVRLLRRDHGRWQLFLLQEMPVFLHRLHKLQHLYCMQTNSQVPDERPVQEVLPPRVFRQNKHVNNLHSLQPRDHILLGKCLQCLRLRETEDAPKNWRPRIMCVSVFSWQCGHVRQVLLEVRTKVRNLQWQAGQLRHLQRPLDHGLCEQHLRQSLHRKSDREWRPMQKLRFPLRLVLRQCHCLHTLLAGTEQEGPLTVAPNLPDRGTSQGRQQVRRVGQQVPDTDCALGLLEV